MKQWHGLTWRGWAAFVPLCIVLAGVAFWGTVKTASILDPGPAVIRPSPAAATTTPHPKASPTRATHRPRHRASSSPAGQARIPGVGSTGGPGVTSVPTHYYRPSSSYVPPATRVPAPVTSTPEPPPSTAETPSATPAGTPTDVPTDTATAPAAAATSAPGWGAAAPAPSTLPDVPGGGSGWIAP